jgi:phage gp36-like protein
MFLSVEDYGVVTNPADLEIITQSSVEIRQRAERTAMEEVAGYIRSRYDIDKAFALSGDDRNPLLVQFVVSIALYYLGMWLPQFLGNDTRETLYDNAIARLRDVQKGALVMDLPQYDTDADGASLGDSLRFGSMKRQKYDY